MNKGVFVDTSAWIMLLNRSQSKHAEAKRIYGTLASSRLITTNLVLGETYTWLRIKSDSKTAHDYLTSLQRKKELGQLEIYFSDYDLELTAGLLLRKYADHPFSYADAVSLALMMKTGLQKAFAYDRHFITAGYTLINQL